MANKKAGRVELVDTSREIPRDLIEAEIILEGIGHKEGGCSDKHCKGCDVVLTRAVRSKGVWSVAGIQHMATRLTSLHTKPKKS